MRRISIIAMAMCVALASALFASGQGESTSGANKSYHFVIVNNEASWSHFYPDYTGAALACKEISAATGDHLSFNVVGPAQNSLLAEVNAMQEAIVKKPAGFLVIAWDPNVMVAPIDQAMDQGIPVITIDADSPASKRLMYIGTDWAMLGQLLGEHLMKLIGGKGLVEMQGLLGADNMDTAYAAFRKVAAKYPNVKIIGPYADKGSVSTAAQVASSVIQAHPDIAGFAGFEAASGPGIATAVREAGKAGVIKVVGNDVNTAQIQDLKNGSEQFVLGQKREFFGYWGIYSLYMHIKTGLHFTSNDKAAGIENIPPRIVTGFLQVTPKNADLLMAAFEKYTKMKFTWGD